MPDPKPVTIAHRTDARERLAVACKGIDEWTATGTWPAQEWHDRDSFSAHRSTLSILAQAIADAEERGRQELPSPERLNRIRIPLPECEVSNSGHIAHLREVANGHRWMPQLLSGIHPSESQALAHVAPGARFRPILVLEPIPARAALEGKP